jgi:hypothetical protein
VVNAVLLRPLAYRDGDRLVRIVTYDDRVGSLFIVRAAEHTAHPNSGPRRRPGFTQDAACINGSTRVLSSLRKSSCFVNTAK